MIIEAVIDRLRDSSVFSTHVGHRVYMGSLPQAGERPAVLVNQLTATPLDQLDGQPTHDETTLQIDIWVDSGGNSSEVINALGGEVRRLLEGVRWDDGTYTVLGATIERDNLLHSPPYQGADEWLRRRSMDLRITHSNAITRD